MSPPPIHSRRERGLAHIRARMLRHGHPRTQMLALLVVTGGAGFAAAFAMLHLGVRAMAVRYPLAVLVAYGTFLLALRIWLGTMMRRHERRRASSGVWGVDVPAFGRSGGGSGGSGAGDVRFGGGGGFAGGGAGGEWEPAPAPVVLPVAAPPPPGPALQGVASSGARTSSGSRGGKFRFGLGDLDDDSAGVLALALLALAAFALVAAVGYILMIAPALLTELVVDGIVVSGLYRRVRTIDDREWLRTAVRRTWIPALLIALLLGAVGFGVQRLVPQARSIGDVWRVAHARHRAD
jgi:hypothetical protein